MASSSEMETRYLPTREAYEEWADIYDTCNNFMPPLSTQLLNSLLNPLLPSLPLYPLIIDLGCGTGRTTQSLLGHPGADVLGLDASPAMLAVARRSLTAHFESLTGGANAARPRSWHLAEWDLLAAAAPERAASMARVLPAAGCRADLVVSTLVLEHVPLDVFFSGAASLLRPSGLLVVTNMHAEMGARTQAGFVNAAGVKVRGTSYVHEVSNVLAETARCGFRIVGQIEERSVTDKDLGALSEGERERARKWLGKGRVLFGGVWRSDKEKEEM